MQQGVRILAIAAVFTLFPVATMSAAADRFAHDDRHPDRGPHVQLGPRPFYLVDKMDRSRLKRDLQKCTERPFFYQTDFSIGHRGGGALQFPEHTKESHEAGARMGAGILECDVTFTSDGELVCRHDQCDLHTTTNILITPLADKCSVPFSAAEFDASGIRTKAASALCCTSDLTLEEFKSLKGKMDASAPNATTAQACQGGTANWRTDLYATGGTLLSHKDSIKRCLCGAQPGVARSSAAQRGLDKRRGMGEGSTSEVPWGGRPRDGRFWTEGGRMSNGIAKAQRPETPLRYAHIAYETRRHIVG